MYDVSYHVETLGDQWQAKDGNFTKRLSRMAYKIYQVKLAPEILSQVGCSLGLRDLLHVVSLLSGSEPSLPVTTGHQLPVDYRAVRHALPAYHV